MKRIIGFSILVIALISVKCNAPRQEKVVQISGGVDSIPKVFSANHNDILYQRLRLEAATDFAFRELPDSLKEWESYRGQLREKIREKTGFDVDHTLPLNLIETGSTKMNEYTVKNIFFQTQPDIYATANLFIPDGNGPFPGVIVMAGHYINGRLGGVQTLGHELAMNGFVTMTIDPWGAGERTTNYGAFEYHGANLGASLLNIGESLMGLQITDNMRGVDLLCSLPYVDSDKIGATGASGGGNQTMWLAAMDDRVKAAVPVVSVGTFEAYVMGHNCICETLVDGLTFTEEAGVLGLVAPRALLISNGLRDATTAFYPSEMIRSFKNAKPVFELYGAGQNLNHLIFDGPHSYPAETRKAMLDLFNVHLKGLESGTPIKEITQDNRLPEEKLMNFPSGQRDSKVLSTAEFCKEIGNELRTAFLNKKSFDANQKRDELRKILRLNKKADLNKTIQLSSLNGWGRFILESADGNLIPVCHIPPSQDSKDYVIVCNPDGTENISLSSIDEWRKKGIGIAVVDLSGTGESSSSRSAEQDQLAKLHTLARADFWLGKTVLGEWVNELDLVSRFLVSHFDAGKISINGIKEAGLAGLFLCATEGNIENVVLQDAPISYLFDDRSTIDYFNMGIHLPGFLTWGDVSLATALSGKDVTFINPLTMSGRELSENELTEYKKEFEDLREICKQTGKTVFITFPDAE